MKRKEAPSNPHLAERIDQLSIKRQEIIRPILEHPREFVLLSVRAMATRPSNGSRNESSASSAGSALASYREFQRHLHELSLAYATSLDTMQSAAAMGAGRRTYRLSRAGLNKLAGLKNSLDGTAPRSRWQNASTRPSDRSARRRPGS